MFLKRIAATAMLIVLITGLTACGTSPEAEEGGNKAGEEIVIVAQAEPESLDPHRIESAPAKEILFNMYEGLVGVDTDGSIIPLIAKDWEISEDNMHYRFFLRSDVLFHNGAVVTAEDVKFSLERLIDERYPYHKDFEVIEDIEIEDSTTIAVQLEKPYAPFLANLALVTAAVVPQEAVGQLNKQAIGTGPYQLDSWDATQAVKLSKFEDYWQDNLPKVEKVTFQIISDSFSALQALKTGQVDIVPRIETASLPEVEQDPNLHIESSPQNLVQLLAINNAREPFNNVLVRKALNYAVDKQEIIAGVMEDKGTEIASNMSPVMGVWYKDLTDMYPHDPQKARELLAEAGYPDGFSTVVTIPSAWQQHIDTGELIKSQLAKVGIDVEIQLMEFGIWLEQVYSNRDYDLTIIGFDGRIDPHQLLDRYVSSYPKNFVNFDNDEYNSLIEAGVSTADIEQRQQVYWELQEILAAEAASVYIQDMDMIVAMSNKIKGWKFYPIYVIDAKELSKE